jgi:hypothetical protein
VYIPQEQTCPVSTWLHLPVAVILLLISPAWGVIRPELQQALPARPGTPENNLISMGIIEDVAGTILDGFNRHYELFRDFSSRARLHFEQAAWKSGREDRQNASADTTGASAKQ